jgi:hypothetical protein
MTFVWVKTFPTWLILHDALLHVKTFAIVQKSRQLDLI